MADMEEPNPIGKAKVRVDLDPAGPKHYPNLVGTVAGVHRNSDGSQDVTIHVHLDAEAQTPSQAGPASKQSSQTATQSVARKDSAPRSAQKKQEALSHTEHPSVDLGKLNKYIEQQRKVAESGARMDLDGDKKVSDVEAMAGFLAILKELRKGGIAPNDFGAAWKQVDVSEIRAELPNARILVAGDKQR